MLEMLYVKILKQMLILTKSEYGIARLGSGLLGTNIKAMYAQLVGYCESWWANREVWEEYSCTERSSLLNGNN